MRKWRISLFLFAIFKIVWQFFNRDRQRHVIYSFGWPVVLLTSVCILLSSSFFFFRAAHRYQFWICAQHKKWTHLVDAAYTRSFAQNDFKRRKKSAHKKEKKKDDASQMFNRNKCFTKIKSHIQLFLKVGMWSHLYRYVYKHTSSEEKKKICAKDMDCMAICALVERSAQNNNNKKWSRIAVRPEHSKLTINETESGARDT